MKWVEALKQYNAGKKWSVPRKGSPEYAEVMKIMGKEAPAAAAAPAAAPAAPAEKKPRKPRERKVKPAPAAAPAAPVAEAPKAKVKRERAPRVKKVVADDPSSNAVEAKPRVGKVKAKAGSVPADIIPEGATKRAVMKSKNPEAVLESATNAHLPVVPAEAMVGLKGIQHTKKHLRAIEHPALPELVDKDKPVDGVPFSFQKLRNELGC
jgi:hypothetical protein